MTAGSTFDDLPGLSDVRAARKRIGDRLHRTPLWRSRTLSERTGHDVWLKCENLQRTGSFKPRGAINRIATLDGDARARGVITISAGNHAQGVAFAASALDVQALIVMPERAVHSKVVATRAYGAEVVLHGGIVEAFEKLEELRQERGLTLVHPFDDPMLIAGHGTVALEIDEQLDSIDAVVCGVGGGGLISGLSTAFPTLSPSTRLFCVEPHGAATMTRALEAGRPVRLDTIDTIADGLASPFAGAHNLELVRRHAVGVVRVSDEEIGSAMRLLLERTKLLVEPSGAACLAALLQGRVELTAHSRVVLVLSGGNVDVDRLGELLR